MEDSITQLLQDRENPRLDFKREASSPQKIVQDVGAFANTSGGVVIVGVDDDGSVVGVTDPQGAEATISQVVNARTDPPLRPTIGFHTLPDGAELLIVSVHYSQGPDPVRVKATNGSWRVYECIGSTSKPVEEDRIEQMRRERRGTDTFDQVAAPVDLQALDLAFARQQFSEQGLELDDALLRTSEVVTDVNDLAVPTNAGLLLFGADPQAVHQDAFIRCARYSGERKTHRVAEDDLTHGPLLKLLDAAERFIGAWTGTVTVGRDRLQRIDIPHYSEDVIRELLVNAITHANYEVTGQRFSIQIFSDRLAITSPGRWPMGMTQEQLQRGISRPRNRAFVNILRRLRYVEHSGSAWDKMLDAHEQHGYPLPSWEEIGYVIRVTVPVHPSANTALPATQDESGGVSGGVNGGVNGGVPAPGSAALARGPAARRRGQILATLAATPANVSDLRKAFGAAQRTLERDMTELVRLGLIEFTGPPKTGVYELTDAGRAAATNEHS